MKAEIKIIYGRNQQSDTTFIDTIIKKRNRIKGQADIFHTIENIGQGSLILQ